MAAKTKRKVEEQAATVIETVKGFDKNLSCRGFQFESGYQGRVSGADGCALFLVERDDNYKIIAAWAGIVGRDGIKADTFYMLRDGKPVEASE
jgi:hypothetical protein